jgi:hypothetical protein
MEGEDRVRKMRRVAASVDSPGLPWRLFRSWRALAIYILMKAKAVHFGKKFKL